MPNEKVETAIFDNDLKCRTVKKYEVSDNGDQIRIVSGGEGHWMPSITTESFVEMPRRKRYFLFGELLWRRLYFVKRKGEKCVNFSTGEAYGPNPEEAKKALGATMLGQIGQEKQEFGLYNLVTIVLVIFLILIELGVFR